MKLRTYRRNPDYALVGMANLTWEERGVYNTLIDLGYSRQAPPPDDWEFLHLHLGGNERAWKRVRASLILKGKLKSNGQTLVPNGLEDGLEVIAESLAKVSAKFGRSKSENVTKSTVGASPSSSSSFKKEYINSSLKEAARESAPAREAAPPPAAIPKAFQAAADALSAHPSRHASASPYPKPPPRDHVPVPELSPTPSKPAAPSWDQITSVSESLLATSIATAAVAKKNGNSQCLQPTTEDRQVTDGYDANDDFARSIDACYEAIRERKANGGPGWTPPDMAYERERS